MLVKLTGVQQDLDMSCWELILKRIRNTDTGDAVLASYPFFHSSKITYFLWKPLFLPKNITLDRIVSR